MKNLDQFTEDDIDYQTLEHVFSHFAGFLATEKDANGNFFKTDGLLGVLSNAKMYLHNKFNRRLDLLNPAKSICKEWYSPIYVTR